MLKRDCSKEDLGWETERKQLGRKLICDAIIELMAEKEQGREEKRLTTMIIGQ